MLKRTVFHGDAAPFIMELPAYRLPTPANVLRQMWDKAKDFLQRAFTVIFLATLIVWFLQNFTFRLEMTSEIGESMLGKIAGLIAPVFAPAGFGSVEASTAVITGLMAKESVVSTLAVLSGVDAESAQMVSVMTTDFSLNAGGGVLSGVRASVYALRGGGGGHAPGNGKQPLGLRNYCRPDGAGVDAGHAGVPDWAGCWDWADFEISPANLQNGDKVQRPAGMKNRMV